MSRQQQHFLQGGNNHQATFHKPQDYQPYKDWPLETAHRYRCEIRAFVFIIDYVRLLFPVAEDPSQIPSSLYRSDSYGYEYCDLRFDRYPSLGDNMVGT